MTNPKYAAAHQRMRRALLPSAVGSSCVRCGLVILPGQPVDLDHLDDGSGRYAGWSHSTCNRSAGGKRGRAVQLAKKRKRGIVFTRCTLGIQISEDRQHTAIACAGWVDDEFILVELGAYLAGTDPVEAVLRLRRERTVTAVMADPLSQAATTFRLLAKAGVHVKELTSHQVAAAFGEFLDALAAGQLKHSGQPELTAAVQHGTQRPLAGAATWQRRGAAVDTSPLDAASFAVWGLRTRPSYDLLASVADSF